MNHPGLLTQADGLAYEIVNPDGKNPLVLVCEHAANRIPEQLDNLGLDAQQLVSHVAWDPGARDLATRLSEALDAPLVAARFSRLVYDCNRPPTAPSAMPEATEVCTIPGNIGIDAAQRQARTDAIYHPFHRALAELIQNKRRQGLDPVVVTVHSFTPVYHGQKRRVEVGLLHDADDRLSRALKAGLLQDSKYRVELNEPYGPRDGVLHCLEKHLEDGPFPYVMIEVRNDLLADENHRETIFSLLNDNIPGAVSSLGSTIANNLPETE